MPQFSRLSESELQRVVAPKAQPEYVDFLRTLTKGNWASVELVPDETSRIVKLRLRQAGKLLDMKIRWRRNGRGTELLFSVEEAPEMAIDLPAAEPPRPRPAPLPRCERCNGRMRLERELDGVEMVCTACGHVQYPAGFVALDKPDLPLGQRNREPRHSGVRL